MISLCWGSGLVIAQANVGAAPSLEEQVPGLIQQETRTAVDRIFAPSSEEVRATANQIREMASSQPTPIPHVPFRLREKAQEDWQAELSALRTSYEDQVRERFDQFTEIRTRPQPTKGRRGDYTDYNDQFQPIKRRK